MVTNGRSRRIFIHTVIVVAAGCIACVALGLGAQLAIMRQRALDFAALSAAHLATVSGDYVEESIEAADAVLRDMVHHAHSQPLNEVMHHQPAVTGVAVIDTGGSMRRSTGFPAGLSVETPTDTDLHVTARTLDGVGWLVLSRRLQTESGTLRGVAVAAIALERFDRVLRGGESVNQAGLYLPDGRRLAPAAEVSFPPQAIDPGQADAVEPGRIMRRLSMGNLVVAAFVNHDETLKSWRADLLASIPAAILLVLVLGVGAGLLVAVTNRNYRHHAGSLNAMKDLNAELEGLVAKRTAALQEARADAEKASEAKSRFLASAAHDLRQPMQAMMMFIDELGYRPLADQDKAVVAKVESSAQSLSHLLNGLLDISAIDAGAIEPRVVDVPLAQVLAAIDARFGGPADAKKLALTVLPTRASVRSDPVLLLRILSNLVSNAVRYTEAGRVLVGCRRRGGDLLVQVVDTGIGIPPEQMPLIFEEYYQVANKGRDRRAGTGLGLAIVERLAGLLGHQIEVASRPGHGSTFTVRMKLADCATAAKCSGAAEPVSDGGGALVVVVEDDPEVRQSLTRSLKNRRYAVLPATSVREAVDLLHWAGRPPAAVVADYRLAGGETGIQAIAALRALHPTRKCVAIVLTGEQKLAEDLGADIVLLRKPVPPAVLCATIERLRREAEVDA
ncbi:MAG TPA: hybrid sensor histidine kinase/response regulator [Magnetospirillum sp.]|nr:hybrid sensor histidine kinase/response regulator [Magnetospirillum sp.]